MRVCVGATTTFLLSLVACLLLRLRATRAFTPTRTLASVIRHHQLVPNGPSYTRTTSPPSKSTLSVYNSDEHDEEWLQRELAALKQNDNYDDATADNVRNTTNTNNRATRASVGPGRAGGRTRRVKTNHDRSASSGIKTSNWWIQAGIPVLAIAILVKTLLGGGGDTAPVTSSPSVYYYKSSYYESRVYTGNGNMERTQSQVSNPMFRVSCRGQKLLPQSSQRPLSKEESPTSEYV